MTDKVIKDRQDKGETHGMAKISEMDALAIIADPRPHTIIAPEYGISGVTVSDIKRGKSWFHLDRSKLVRRRKAIPQLRRAN